MSSYPLPPGLQEIKDGSRKGGKVGRPCAALTWHGNPCSRHAKDNDTLCNSHREQAEKESGRPVRLIGGGIAMKRPQGEATVISLFDGSHVDMSGFDPTREPLTPGERRRLAYLQMEHVVVHGTPPQQTKAAELIFKYTPDLEKEAAEERSLDDEIFELTEAMAREAGLVSEEPVPVSVQVQRLTPQLSRSEMDEHLRDLERLGVIEQYETEQEAV